MCEFSNSNYSNLNDSFLGVSRLWSDTLYEGDSSQVDRPTEAIDLTVETGANTPFAAASPRSSDRDGISVDANLRELYNWDPLNLSGTEEAELGAGGFEELPLPSESQAGGESAVSTIERLECLVQKVRKESAEKDAKIKELERQNRELTLYYYNLKHKYNVLRVLTDKRERSRKEYGQCAFAHKRLASLANSYQQQYGELKTDGGGNAPPEGFRTAAAGEGLGPAASTITPSARLGREGRQGLKRRRREPTIEGARVGKRRIQREAAVQAQDGNGLSRVTRWERVCCLRGRLSYGPRDSNHPIG